MQEVYHIGAAGVCVRVARCGVCPVDNGMACAVRQHIPSMEIAMAQGISLGKPCKQGEKPAFLAFLQHIAPFYAAPQPVCQGKRQGHRGRFGGVA